MKLVQKIALSYVRSKLRMLSALSPRKAAAEAFELFCTPQHKTRKKLPSIFEQATSQHLILNNVRVNGWQWNKGGARKTLIIHGFESSATNFEKYIKALVQKGHEVLAFDAPAHGRSGGKKITAPVYAGMIKEICERYGPIDSFLAHSFGGLALCLALEQYDHSPLQHVVLIAAATETTTAIDSFFRFLQLNDKVRFEFEKLIVKTGGVSSSWYSISRSLRHIRANILWFHDKDDDTTPLSDAMEIKNKNYENIRFVITTGLGHRRIYRDNKVMKEAITFL